ncbi:porphobilinogen synthase [Phaeacidiphilus oryzae]|uniref:porphobilinogen synthase n=1 Tax=Phaeacidiphilus oryzae TaxID=348818 RepID=UPI00068C5D68|nr:porphobilinogen synthase [Phaeacidiphilus oryzae]
MAGENKWAIRPEETPVIRPRRLRSTAAMRRLVAETRLHPAELILPVFVREGISEPVPLAAMPGVVQHTRDTLKAAAVEAVEAGVGGLMIYGVPEVQDAAGSEGTNPDGILQQAIRDVIAEVGDEIVVMSDLCLDEYTDHGHCGVLAEDGSVDNDATLARYAEMAVVQADAGVHVVAPSGMMDGQVRVARRALDEHGHTDVAILAYTAKYASAFYGPFREAVGSSLKGDRKAYQQDPGNAREALRELELDVAEGADLVMVKPGMVYLDILSAVAEASPVPVSAYQVSGEYAMIEAAAANGWIDRDRAIMEALTALRRAGAEQILTYWAVEAARNLRQG